MINSPRSLWTHLRLQSHDALGGRHSLHDRLRTFTSLTSLRCLSSYNFSKCRRSETVNQYTCMAIFFIENWEEGASGTFVKLAPQVLKSLVSQGRLFLLCGIKRIKAH